MKTGKQIILASASPRRQQLLKVIGLDFLTHPSNFEEKETHLSPEELALHNAIGKCQDVSGCYKDALIIGADTVVAVGEHFLGKPKDNEDAKRILRLLSNSTHQVITAIAIFSTNNQKMLTSHTTTLVTIDRLEEEDIENYVKSGEGADKAAGYAIQGLGSLFIKRIEGDYFNVVGLPVYTLRKMLHELGVKIPYKTLPNTQQYCIIKPSKQKSICTTQI